MKKYSQKQIKKAVKKYMNNIVESDYEYLKSKKVPENIIETFIFIDQELKRIRFGIDTLMKVMVDKKLATKKELDNTIDEIFTTEVKKLKI